ncbi:hypothetical protein CBR_g234 [Chara braunii]|uniref:Acid phosphatase n=1 Tax=Chara braunii TaxID=69332 RepID=A0A388JM01_CHABU|nr:hypothetical protein CBR_g234 [Chara braunii]|eukprot:GBG58834.1 hypothetical protein CBR_g234 [Chara braunii]
MEPITGSSSFWFLGLVILLALSLGTARCQLQLTTEVVDAADVNDYCMGFIYNTGTDNIQGWVVPPQCEKVVERYMTEGEYQRDVAATCLAAHDYFSSLRPGPTDTVVFDIDETLISNVPYQIGLHWGVNKFDPVSWKEWTAQANAAAIPQVLALYNELKDAGWNLLLLTGRAEDERNDTMANLLRAGYVSWFDLILKSEAEEGLLAVDYKSRRREEFEKKGYTVRGCVGDQWSDLRGKAAGDHAFKLPNPMYYIA